MRILPAFRSTGEHDALFFQLTRLSYYVLKQAMSTSPIFFASRCSTSEIVLVSCDGPFQPGLYAIICGILSAAAPVVWLPAPVRFGVG